MKKKKIALVFIFISLVMVSYSIFKISNWFIDTNKLKKMEESFKSVYQEVIDSKNLYLINPPEDEKDQYYEYINEPFLQVDFTNLLNVNKDTVAWIQVLGTSIDYPVVQGLDNEYYLEHSFDKSTNIAGWVFSDFRNNFTYPNNNSIIYAHKMTNKTMFGSLPTLLSEEWQEDKSKHLIKISTPDSNMIYEIFSVYIIPEESYYIKTQFKDEEEYKTFLNTIKGRSIHDFNTTLNNEDKVLTLSTCQDYNGNRLVVHAKLIKKGNR